ncbi:MAG TPA: hypothetical protein VM577_07360 [Anaerovoracaceae bacterium]|nr:hypothetical protein [Anaerovoracaceae bacterium]
METLIEEFLGKYPNAPKNEHKLPRHVCPDDLGHRSLCDEGFDITVELCRNCWNQTKHLS